MQYFATKKIVHLEFFVTAIRVRSSDQHAINLSARRRFPPLALTMTSDNFSGIRSHSKKPVRFTTRHFFLTIISFATVPLRTASIRAVDHSLVSNRITGRSHCRVAYKPG